jgi:protein gp37
MAEKSKIEWCDHTANLWHGCTKVNAGCDNCYAERLSKRWGKDVWGNDKPRLEIKSVWKDLERFQSKAAELNEKHRVFVGSMMDIFEKPMPMIDSKGAQRMVMAFGEPVRPMFTDQYRDALFHFISQGKYPNLIFLFLTKRPSNINKYIPEAWKTNPPQNVMFGTSVVDQETADKLIPQLLEVKGRKFLSIEPQLDLILFEWSKWVNWPNVNILKEGVTCYDGLLGIEWIIQGGESGPHKRPFNLNWCRYIFDACRAMNIAYFFKQIDKVTPIPDDLIWREFPEDLVN